MARAVARGGFPRAYLTGSDQDSAAWREGFVKTFLERDIPSLGITIPPAALRRFWTMLAHYHGQTWNASELARAMGIADKTVRSYLNILAGAYRVRQLQPWHENLSKRQVKAPKITRSMRTAIEDLKLDRLIVVAPGERSYPIDETIEVVAVRELARLRGIVAERGAK